MLAISGCEIDESTEQDDALGNQGTLTVSGTLNGHDWVDLGLPSGLLWATCNVGATTPEGYGDYYAWGETTTKETYNWFTYRYYDGSNITKYEFYDSLTTLQSSDDAATANWGAGWRMPTKTEMRELCSYCSVTWTTQNGVNGCLFTGSNGNSIFLPAAGLRSVYEVTYAGSEGFYWSSSLDPDGPVNAWELDFVTSHIDAPGGIYMNYYTRRSGRSVRPVCAQ